MIQRIEELLTPYYHEGQTEIDTTSMLRYLRENIESYSFMINDEGDIAKSNGEGFEVFGKTPSKPFNLYNEEELSDLLNILTLQDK